MDLLIYCGIFKSEVYQVFLITFGFFNDVVSTASYVPSNVRAFGAFKFDFNVCHPEVFNAYINIQ